MRPYGKHRIAVGFVKFAENPVKVARRIIDLHILPIGHGSNSEPENRKSPSEKPPCTMHVENDTVPRSL